MTESNNDIFDWVMTFEDECLKRVREEVIKTAEYNYGFINTLTEKRIYRNKFKIYHMTWYKLWDDPKKGPHNLWHEYYREILY